MRTWVAAGALALAGTMAQAETVSELAQGGFVVLNSHYDTDRGVVVFLMGDVQGAPMFVCQTRFHVQEEDDFDQCRKLR